MQSIDVVSPMPLICNEGEPVVLMDLSADFFNLRPEQEVTDIVGQGKTLIFFARAHHHNTRGVSVMMDTQVKYDSLPDLLESIAKKYEVIPGIENICKVVEVSVCYDRDICFFAEEYVDASSTQWYVSSGVRSIIEKHPKFCKNLIFFAYGTEMFMPHRFFTNAKFLKVFAQDIVNNSDYFTSQKDNIALKIPVAIATINKDDKLEYLFDVAHCIKYRISCSALTDIFSAHHKYGWQEAAEKINLVLNEPFRDKVPRLSSDEEVTDWMRKIYMRMLWQQKIEEERYHRNISGDDWQLFTADLHTQTVEKAAPIRKLRELFCSCVAKLNDEQLQQVEECILDANALYIEASKPGALAHFVTKSIQKQLALCIKNDDASALAYNYPAMYDCLLDAAPQLTPQEIVALCSKGISSLYTRTTTQSVGYNYLIQKARNLALNKIYALCEYVLYIHSEDDIKAYKYLVDRAHLLQIDSLRMIARILFMWAAQNNGLTLQAYEYLIDRAITLPENKIASLHKCNVPYSAYKYIVDNAHKLSAAKLSALCMCQNVTDLGSFMHLINLAPTLSEKQVILYCSDEGRKDWATLHSITKPTLVNDIPHLTSEQIKAFGLEDQLASVEYELIRTAVKVISEI